MFEGISLKVILIAVGSAVLFIILTVGYHHYSSIVKDLAIEKANNGKLQLAVTTQQAALSQTAQVIDEWKKSQEETNRTIHEISQQAQAARRQQMVLEQILVKHNLVNLAQKKPGLVQKRANAGTRKALDELRCASDPACRK